MLSGKKRFQSKNATGKQYPICANDLSHKPEVFHTFFLHSSRSEKSPYCRVFDEEGNQFWSYRLLRFRLQLPIRNNQKIIIKHSFRPKSIRK
jgi:hypothetical protein